MRTSNPILSDNVFLNQPRTYSSSEAMTIQGTVNKTFILLALVLVGGFFTWTKVAQAGPQAAMGFTIGGAIVGFIFSLITLFKKESSGITAPIYSLAQGVFLGGISAVFEASYPGVVSQAVGLTFATLFCLLGAYKSGLIKVTENFKMGVFAATGGIALFYFVTFILSLFGIQTSLLNGSGIFSIGISLFVVGIAALNLVLDFDFIEHGSHNGAPKYMEWFAAFGLMVTLIWLYVEILRLLVKLRGRRD